MLLPEQQAGEGKILFPRKDIRRRASPTNVGTKWWEQQRGKIVGERRRLLTWIR